MRTIPSLTSACLCGEGGKLEEPSLCKLWDRTSFLLNASEDWKSQEQQEQWEQYEDLLTVGFFFPPRTPTPMGCPLPRLRYKWCP